MKPLIPFSLLLAIEYKSVAIHTSQFLAATFLVCFGTACSPGKKAPLLGADTTDANILVTNTVIGLARQHAIPYCAVMHETEAAAFYVDRYSVSVSSQTNTAPFSYTNSIGISFYTSNKVQMITGPACAKIASTPLNRAVNFRFKGGYVPLLKGIEEAFAVTTEPPLGYDRVDGIFEFNYERAVSLDAVLIDMAARYGICTESIIGRPPRYHPDGTRYHSLESMTVIFYPKRHLELMQRQR